MTLIKFFFIFCLENNAQNEIPVGGTGLSGNSYKKLETSWIKINTFFLSNKHENGLI